MTTEDECRNDVEDWTLGCPNCGATVGDLVISEDRETVEDWRDRLSDSNDGCANCGYSDRLGVVPYESDSK